MSFNTVDLAIQDEIVREAQQHEGRYLLPHKLPGVDNPKWRACERLVNQGLARWIARNSTHAPGIEVYVKRS